MKKIALLALLLLWAVPLHGQVIQTIPATSTPQPIDGKSWTSASSTTCTDTSDNDTGGCYGVGVVNWTFAYIDVNLTSPAFTAGQLCFEGDDGSGLPPWSTGTPAATWTRDLGRVSVANLITNEQFGPIPVTGLRRFRVRLCNAITGTGTLTFFIQLGSAEGARLPLPQQVTVLTTTALGISGVFTSPWRDRRLDRAICIQSTGRADQASAAAGYVIQHTDDVTDANFGTTLSLYLDDTGTSNVTTVPANTTVRVYACPQGRFWRIVYTNGGTGQGSFKLTAEVNPVASQQLTPGGYPGVRLDSSGAAGGVPPGRSERVSGLGSGATGGVNVTPPIGDTTANINVVTAATFLIVTGVSGRHVRITSISLKAAAADNVAFISGTGATCGTGTTAMMGGTTAATGWNFTASDLAWTQGDGIGQILRTTATGDSVCIITSGAVQLSGVVGYAIY